MTTTKLSWLLAAALLVACSGATTGVGKGGDGGASSSSSGGTECTDSPLQGERTCVPGTAKSGAEITVAVDGTGCVACGGTLLPCQVTVSGTTITITAIERDCATTAPCAASCGLPQTTCTIPPLASGTYQVVLASGGSSEDSTVRQLVVTDDAADTSCTLPMGDPPLIVASEFPQACMVDSDCTMVAVGNACSACTCPTAAIAKSALPAYQAEYRERAAECRSTGQGTADCAPCEQVPPRCNLGTCEAGTTK